MLRPGEADASVIAPLPGRMTGLAFSVDGNPFYGLIDPYQGGALGVCEAARNVAAVGAVPATITDCLNYGNPEVEEVFWEFSEGVRGIGDACRGIGHLAHEGSPLPVVSGNVSFYNQSESGKSIPPSPVLCCVGVVEDYSKCRSIQFKEEGDTLYLARRHPRRARRRANTTASYTARSARTCRRPIFCGSGGSSARSSRCTPSGGCARATT